jgi:hypothetical protein
MLYRQYTIEVSVFVYRGLLCLYPAEFRRQFGEEMVQAFRDWLEDESRQSRPSFARVCFVASSDVISTCIHQHADVLTRWASQGVLRCIAGVLRLAALAAILILAVSTVLNPSISWEGRFALSLGLMGLAWGAIAAQGRGVRCLVSATGGGIAGFAVGLLCVFCFDPPTGDWFVGVALLLAMVAVASLACATCVRVVVEGLVICRPNSG